MITLPQLRQVFLGENILKYTVSPQSSHVIEQYSIMHLPNGVIDNWPFFSFLDFCRLNYYKIHNIIDSLK